LFVRLVVGSLFLSVLAMAQPARKTNFDREIRPILSDNCFACHGPDEQQRKVGLRLDTKEGAFAVRGAAPVIVTGNAAESRLYLRVSNEKKALRMPPPGSGLTLTDAQVQLLKRWIDEGADWKTHWSYEAPKRPTPPEVKQVSWPRNDIDRFVLARLEREGLKPSPEAAKATLLRRVTLDLTGLPPTPEEVDSFVKDRAPDAYERRVDQLLASPRYGERMAMHWLDLARFADTHGYHIDSHRDMWPWRDWVISAYNRNLPFDQFTIWQLAGDLLPNATREQRLASGFNRNHMINFEGGAIPEEYQVEYVVDRIEATSTTWMGTTMGCARCHDHKFDPLKQKEFYQFGAFFNTINEKGLDGRLGNADPFLLLPTPDQEKRLDSLKSEIQSREAVLDEKEIAAKLKAWQEEWRTKTPENPTQSLEAWYEFAGSTSDLSGHYRQARIRKGDLTYAAIPSGHAADFDAQTLLDYGTESLDLAKPFTIALTFRSDHKEEQSLLTRIDDPATRQGFEIATEQTVVLPHLRRGQKVAVRLSQRWPSDAAAVRTKDFLIQGNYYHLAVVSDGSGRAAGIRIYLDGKPVETEILADKLSRPVVARRPVETGNKDLGDAFDGRLSDVRFYSRVLSAPEVNQIAVHYPMETLAGTGKPTKEQEEKLREYYLTYAAPEPLRGAFAALTKLRKEKEDLEETIPTVMVMKELDKPRDTFVLARGDYQQKRDKVLPGVPSVFPPLPKGEPPNRLALARWLVDPAHPLTARVAVNRYWQMYFGVGIVKTLEDFGSQGEPPSHPDLLDWLATEFIRTDWDIKAMQKLIVTSATYRQSSKVTPELYEKDPENRLLARGPRFRLPAEMVRDNALAVSGLLNPQIGGPSVLPYQPAGVWEELAYGDVYSAQAYVQDHGDKLYRRGMYTFWKRTAPPAMLTTFDAPDREKCTARRAVTNTPLQALALLNDTTFLEASRAFAQRVLLEDPKASVDTRLRKTFQLATARYPDNKELQVLRGALKQQLDTYGKDPHAAEKLVKIGESPAAANLDPKQLAAWTNVCTVVLNLDETITKE
jgi:hypothetical protein